MSNFEPNAILRGAQLTLVGAYRALQNPGLFKTDHYKHAALAVALGIIIQVVVSIPVLLAKSGIFFINLFADLQTQTWDDKLINSLDFLQHSVLQVPFFLMTLLKYVTPAMDNMFMESLEWVDKTYVVKHKSDDPTKLRALYYPSLRQWQMSKDAKSPHQKNPLQGAKALAFRYGRKGLISLAIFLLSMLPYVGKLVLPAASFYTFRKAVGQTPALVIFGTGILLPRRYLITFLQSYFASKHLTRELLEPYFSRVKFDAERKKKWFLDREGVLFGFGVGFFLLIKIPIFGVLVYGIAEASAAFLITKITDPPPVPSSSEVRDAYINSQVTWENKKEFLKLPIANIDAVNIETDPPPPYSTTASEMPRKRFT